MSNIKQPFQKARVLFKMDSIENWHAAEDDFQTLRGELYFYNNAQDTGRINHAGQKIFKPSLKIGNGSSSLKNLAFWRENYITIEQISELFNPEKHSGILGLDRFGTFYLGRLGSSLVNNELDDSSLDKTILD